MEIRPELQQLSVGDRIVLHGRSGVGPQVARLDAERALVLGGWPNDRGSQATWAFYLLDGPNGRRDCSSGDAGSLAGGSPRSSGSGRT